MKTRQALAFIAGIMMLCCAPYEDTNWTVYLLVWLPIALGLIAWSGAVKKYLTTEKEEHYE